MAVSFDATVGSADATSYATIAEADQYAIDYALSIWAALTDEDVKKQYLNKAAQYIDSHYGDRLTGYKETTTQSLEYPRDYIYDDQSNILYDGVIPPQIKSAQIEAANYFAAGTDITADKGKAVTSESLQGLGKIDYRDYGLSQDVRTRIDQLIRYPLIQKSGLTRWVRA
jgi:hypothetical protein